MKYPAKVLAAAALALALAFTSLSAAVFAAEPNLKEITAGDHDTLINEYKQFYADELKAQAETFSIGLKGDALDLYEFSKEKLVLKSTGEEDPYFPNDEASIKNTIKMLLDKFSSVPANEYIANVVVSSGIGIDYSFNEGLKITLTFFIQWDETKPQTGAVRGWAEKWADDNLGGLTGDYNKVKAIHDFIVNNYSYDSSLVVRTAYGMMTGGEGVCESYALMARALLDAAGIESRLVFVDSTATNNKGTENHMWNLVRVDGGWYHMDVTWDDPVGGSLRHDYFLKGDETMEKDHSWNVEKLPAAPKDYTPGSSGSSSAPGPGSSKPNAGSSSRAASSARHGVSVAPDISLPGASAPQQSGVYGGDDSRQVSRDYGAYSEGGGHISRAPAAEGSGGGGSLRMLWLLLAAVCVAAAAAAVFALKRRGGD